MRFACWITKVINTHSEYVILIAFPLQYTVCPGGNVPDFGIMFLMLVHRYNPKHLYPKLNGYGDNG